MSIRRSSTAALAALSLLAAACGQSDSAKSSPRDAVGQGSAEGEAAGTSPTSGEVTESLGPDQHGAAANDTVPHRPTE
ncbi:MAG TPA: hypothetical protein VFQ76_09520, partial [Longimicrobiaceae bacterium]|nr:hypothetical protein [Longimicrobiaceae bacterium]